MIKEVFTTTMLFSSLALAEPVDLSCFSSAPVTPGKHAARISVVKYGDRHLELTDLHGTYKFNEGEFEEVFIERFPWIRVVLADNGFNQARIVVNSRGQADVSIQDSSGAYLTARKVISCSKYQL